MVQTWSLGRDFASQDMASIAGFLGKLGLRDSVLLGVAVLLVAAWVLQQLFFTVRYPLNLPRIDGSKSRFNLGTRWRYHADSLGLFKEAYETVRLPMLYRGS
jgi:hypothetical protein